MKKRIFAFILCAVILLPTALSGCSETRQDYSDEFQDFATGIYITLDYTEAMDNYFMLKDENGNDYSKTGSLRLCKIEIISTLSDEESRQYWLFPDIPAANLPQTYYNARVIYDYSSENKLSEDIIYAQEGSISYQFKGNPPFSSGDQFVTILTKDPDKAYYGSLFGYNSLYDIAGNNILLRSVSCPEMADIELAMTEDEKSRITTTEQNPAKYGAKYALEDFVSFVLADWKERGIIE